MAIMKSLSFVVAPKSASDPVLVRRSKLIERLEEQKDLWGNPTLTRTIQRWAKIDGQRQPIEKHLRISPWWKTDANGQLVLGIKFGSRLIEFEKGKAGIAVPSKEKLPLIIDTIIAATKVGELDDLLSHASKQRSFVKAKKAA